MAGNRQARGSLTGAKLIGGGPGDLGSVLSSLVDALKSVVAALGGGPTVGGGLPGASPKLAPAPNDPSQRSKDGLLHTTSVSGRQITIAKEGDSFRLQQPTRFDEAVYVDDTLLAFDQTGRHLSEAELVRRSEGSQTSLWARAESGRLVGINRFPGMLQLMPPTGQPERVQVDGRVQLFDGRGTHTGTA